MPGWNLRVATGLRFIVWLAIGLAVYVGWPYRHSCVETGATPHDKQRS